MDSPAISLKSPRLGRARARSASSRIRILRSECSHIRIRFHWDGSRRKAVLADELQLGPLPSPPRGMSEKIRHSPWWGISADEFPFPPRVCTEVPKCACSSRNACTQFTKKAHEVSVRMPRLAKGFPLFSTSHLPYFSYNSVFGLGHANIQFTPHRSEISAKRSTISARWLTGCATASVKSLQ